MPWNPEAVFLPYEIVKYETLKSIRGYQKAFAGMDFLKSEISCPSRDQLVPVSL